MVCQHLRELEKELLEAGIKETFRGAAWSDNCREWVYFDCYLDRKSIRKRIPFASCVADHEYRGTHDGQEAGFVCEICRDGIMGVHKAYADSVPTFK